MDSIDRKILGFLQDDATMSIQELGEKVNLSSNPCWRRVQRLESEGIIERRVAIIDGTKIGLGLTTFVTIRTNQHDATWLARFAQAVKKIPEIVECHRMSGDTDYLLKVVVADVSHYDSVYQRLIAAVPGLSDVSSAFSMERLKYCTAIDVSTAPD